MLLCFGTVLISLKGPVGGSTVNDNVKRPGGGARILVLFFRGSLRGMGARRFAGSIRYI